MTVPSRHTRIIDRVITRLKFKQLRLLVAVGDHGNIQNAAREMNVSQPAATKMIKDLELDFEVQLFERTNRGVIPTAFGDALIRHGKLIFAQVSNAAQELDDLVEGNSGRVVIGTLLAASSRLLPMAIERVLTDRPRIAIKVVEGTNDVLMPDLHAGDIDLVVGRLSTHRHRSNLVQEKLFDERIVAVVGPDHPLVGVLDVSFQMLQPFGWILPPTETSLRREIDRFFLAQDQYVPPSALESVSYLTNRRLLQSRNFIGVMPAHVAAQDISGGALQRLDWSVPFGEGPVGVSYRQQGQLSPAGLAVLQALRDTSKVM
ncbi:LysR substrate-binding domain-containing protein [Phaeobacter marinintestinus]|uniref:LysR substrate-binding domain-containing protein n=1 Tax=Falsiphaeobacter marinintestinus TaxID=1492905 RepID=UPI0011B63636|nr:LysR substrate-binding domain-containing protein [Phaeobacter marinintestinus]